MKERKNIFLFFIRMLAIAFVTLLVTELLSSLFSYGVFNEKYGIEFITEAFFAIIMLLFLTSKKNIFLFRKSREPFSKSLSFGLPFLIFACILFKANQLTLIDINIYRILNLFLYCAMIGIAEELMCREWIQNEFIKRFGDTRKGVYFSIILSSLIFGAIHLLNLFAGQTLLETILQVLQAVSSGFLFGAIYYRTGNIWSTIFLHGFYDFSIMMGESNNYVDCVRFSNPSLISTVYSSIISLLIILLYTLNGLKILDKNSVLKIINNEEITEKPNKKRNKKFNIAMTIIVILILLPVNFDDSNDIDACYSFNQYNPKEDYELRYMNINKENYEIIGGTEGVKYKFSIDDNYNLILKTETSSIKLIKDIDFYEIVELNDYYVMIAQQTNITSTKNLYLKIDKNKMIDDNKYLDKLKKSIKEIVVPEVKEIGYIYINDGEEIYPIIKSNLDDIFIIEDEENIDVLVK